MRLAGAIVDAIDTRQRFQDGCVRDLKRFPARAELIHHEANKGFNLSASDGFEFIV
jgi:hypothetical protein